MDPLPLPMIRPTFELLDRDGRVIRRTRRVRVSVQCTESGSWEVVLEGTAWVGLRAAERVRVLREDGETQSVLALNVPARLGVVDVTVHLLLGAGRSVFQELGVEW